MLPRWRRRPHSNRTKEFVIRWKKDSLKESRVMHSFGVSHSRSLGRAVKTFGDRRYSKVTRVFSLHSSLRSLKMDVTRSLCHRYQRRLQVQSMSSKGGGCILWTSLSLRLSEPSPDGARVPKIWSPIWREKKRLLALGLPQECCLNKSRSAIWRTDG